MVLVKQRYFKIPKNIITIFIKGSVQESFSKFNAEFITTNLDFH